MTTRGECIIVMVIRSTGNVGNILYASTYRTVAAVVFTVSTQPANKDAREPSSTVGEAILR